MIDQQILAAQRLSRDEIHQLQSQRLRALVRHVYDNVPFYRRKMDERGVKPQDIRTAEDIDLLPFTEKSDLRDHYPFGLLAVSRREIVRMHASSGTTGKPTVAAYTREDLDNWTELTARSLALAGIDDTSVVHIAYGYGLFTGGMGVHYGAERLGAAVVPCQRRQHPAPADADGGFWRDGSVLYALLCDQPGRSHAGKGRRYQPNAAENRRFRRGAVERKHAHAH